MGSRHTGNGAENIYAVAELWVEHALKSDDSLFTPGEPIWSMQRLQELHERILDKPVESNDHFMVKFENQLADSSDEKIYQLMGEVLYVSSLISTASLQNKVNAIQKALGWSKNPVKIPPELVDSLEYGLARLGNLNAYRIYHIGFIIEFVKQWKELEHYKVQSLLCDPWEFQKLMQNIELKGELFSNHTILHRAQREALLHLIFPDTFESIINFRDKERITSALAPLCLTWTTDNVDMLLNYIRPVIEEMYYPGVHFYEASIKEVWRPSNPPDTVLSDEFFSRLNKDLTNGINEEKVPTLLTNLAEELLLPIRFLEEIQTLLYDKKQVIFQGPPGTGKTYVAQKLAEHLAGSKDRVTLVQFHPSYAYEDFVQGFRPTTLKNGQAGFELRNGPLARIAKRAQDDPDGKYYLIIDEINRGNLAKIFGELYFLLEYRNQTINLQYSDTPFSLPENLYIIGTMNTADRSIALVDLALRRRFYFVEFRPDKWPVVDLLHNWLSAHAFDMMWVADVVDRANEILGDRNAAIGPSYFMKSWLDEEMVQRIWKYAVLPYIQECLFGEEDRLDDFDLNKLRGLTSEPETADQTQNDSAQ